MIASRELTIRTTLPLFTLLLPAAGLLTAAAPAASRAPAAPAPDTFKRDMAPLVQKYCVGCHGAGHPPAGLSLSAYQDTAAVVKARNVWEKIANNVRSAHMPPPGLPQPSPAERAKMVAWIESTLSQADCKVQDPGRVTMRRLNRDEFNNTIRDLLYTNLRPADEFPTDDVGYGFDNIGDVLSISPLLMDKYLDAAEKIARAVIVTPESTLPPVRYEAELLPGTGDAARDRLLSLVGALSLSERPSDQARAAVIEQGRVLPPAGELAVLHAFPMAGEYVLRVGVLTRQTGRGPARMAIRLDDKKIRAVDVTGGEDAPDAYQARVKVPAGPHRFSVALPAGTAGSPAGDGGPVVVDYLEVQGPMALPLPLPLSHRRIMIAQPMDGNHDACARKIISAFLRRAYRRPVTPAEVERLVRCVHLAEDEGDSFERGIQLAVQAALVSPQFLFRVEVDPHPNDPKAKHLIGPYELASRLSYFLWSSMPDEELFAHAAKGDLEDPKVLAAQARRMLKDSRAHALAHDFAAQWLELRKLDGVTPNPRQFPQFNNKLRQAMRTETEKFFGSIVQEDRSMLEFLDGHFTYLNEPLARLYGIDGIKGDQFRRVSLTGDQRGGLLRQASILTVTSNPTRTSPVKRGKWVLEEILGTPPPPPPPNVPPLDNRRRLTGTLRQQMEQHRKDPNCASCHTSMDPIGFGMENYDAIGRWRTKDGDAPIDASGVLPDGRRFNGPAQLIAILDEQKDQFVRSFSQKLLTYALGRGLEPYDNCNIAMIAGAVAKDNYRFSALITQVVQSDPFRKRRGDGGQA